MLIETTGSRPWLELFRRCAAKNGQTPVPSFAKEGNSPALTVSGAYKGQLNHASITNTSLASPSSRADGVMMVFFPTVIFAFDSIAARTSSSQTNGTGRDSFFSGLGFAGSSSVYEDNGGATGAGTTTGAGSERRPSH